MRSIQRRVVPHLPRWMGIVSGVLLLLAGLAWPVLYTPVGTQAATRAPASSLSNAISDGTGLALTPPMGWNGFNRFYLNVTAQMIEAEARALVDSGMKDAGYVYVNIDGGWDLKVRNPDATLQPDRKKFPDGIRAVSDYIHSLGLKFGIYTSAGEMNCAHTSAGSFGHYELDAATFAAWGVDYLKFDWCWIPYRAYPGLSHRQVAELLASQMAAALANTGRPILFDVNGAEEPWAWAPRMAHMWRTTPDSGDRYPSLMSNFIHNVGHYKSAGPGAWNDPDMLEIGNGGMTTVEYQSQFSLWAEMAAPLIAGNDLTTMSETTRGILTNGAVIAVDQDPLGRQGYPVSSAGGRWVLAKPLTGGAVAVVLFNSTGSAATMAITAAQIGMTRSYAYRMVDLWSNAESDTAGLISARVPAHGVVMYVVSALQSDRSTG